MGTFVHLHNHSHYSLLDGACKIDDMIAAAVADRMHAIALTDHGVMFGAIEFYKKAKKAGIKPILGMEAYIITRGSRFDKAMQVTESGGKRAAYHHIVLLAKNETGYSNLIKLCTLGHTEGFYYKPRIDVDLLRLHRDGLVALSACVGGVVSAHLVSGNDTDAYEAAEVYKSIFGDDFYVEIQDHGIPREAPVLEKAPKLARDLGLKLVATNDIHYLKQEHAVAHNVLLMIPDASATNVQDYRQLKYQTDQAYFKSSKEMTELFARFPEAISSTLEIAEKCDLKLEQKNHMPQFPIPPDAGVETLDAYFEKLAREGFSRRYPQPTPELLKRLDHEIGVITRMEYAGYFLIVSDFIRAAREMGVYVGPGRGSAAGSIVSYALEITNVDPIKYDLLFERFLNPDRLSMPDIDVDFADSKREKVIEYVRNKYGRDAVSQIITFGTLSTRAVLKDVGRVLGIDLGTINSITKEIPVEQGKVMPLSEVFDAIPELKWVRSSPSPQMKDLVDISLVLEGMNRNAGMHAAGVVIAPGNISDFVPLYKTPQQDEAMTQYNMKDLETVGLLKMDFLGLRTLTVIENALRLIRENHGVEISLEAVPEEDPLTFELFSRGDTVGVFQFESTGMQDWLRKLKPTSISDLVAMNALYRPGPMEMIGDFIARKHGRAPITYLHPKLEPILKETYGVIVYQEQVMKIASEIAGFSLAKSDLMRRAMGKKDKALMANQKKEFVDGAEIQKIGRKLGGEIFDLIEKFAAYGFNKSHSVAYSVIAYQTGYLKAHYPAEFMAANLTSEMGDTDKIVKFIGDCRKRGLNVLPPDVNESGTDFRVVPDGIRFGLAAIKNVGQGAVESIQAAREKEGPFTGLFDFCSRVDLRLVNKKCVESLVMAGAFDSLGGHRAQFFENIGRAADFGQVSQLQEQQGQGSLFDDPEGARRNRQMPQMAVVPAWSEFEKLGKEKSVLGFYLSGHPLRKHEQEVNEFASVRLGELTGYTNGKTVRVAGIVTAVRKKVDKRNNTMAFVGIEDFTGRAECIVFADPYAKYQQILVPDSLVLVTGKGELNGDTLRILVSDVLPLEKAKEKLAKGIVLSVDVNDIKEQTIVRLREIMERHKGNCPCFFRVRDARSVKIFQSTKFHVEPTEQFLEGVRQVLGPDSVRLTADLQFK